MKIRLNAISQGRGKFPVRFAREPAASGTVPAEWSERVTRHPAVHPLQSPEHWDLQSAGAAVGGLGPDDAWTYGFVRPKLFRPLVKGPSVSVPLFVPVGNELPGADTPHATAAILASLVDALPDLSARAIYLDELEVGSQTAESAFALASSGDLTASWVGRPQRSWLLRFPPNREDYWGAFHTDTRRKLRRVARKIEGTFRVFRDPGDAPEFLKLAAEISRNSWQHEVLGTRIRTDEEAVALYTALARAGVLHGMVQWAGDRPVAFVRAYRIGTRLFIDESGFDASVPQLRPGTALWVHGLDDLIANPADVELIDFGFGDAEYKERLGNESVERNHLILTRRDKAVQAMASVNQFAHSTAFRAHEWLQKKRGKR